MSKRNRPTSREGNIHLTRTDRLYSNGYREVPKNYAATPLGAVFGALVQAMEEELYGQASCDTFDFKGKAEVEFVGKEWKEEVA